MQVDATDQVWDGMRRLQIRVTACQVAMAQKSETEKVVGSAVAGATDWRIENDKMVSKVMYS